MLAEATEARHPAIEVADWTGREGERDGPRGEGTLENGAQRASERAVEDGEIGQPRTGRIWERGETVSWVLLGSGMGWARRMDTVNHLLSLPA